VILIVAWKDARVGTEQTQKKPVWYGDLSTSRLQADRRNTDALIALSFSSIGQGVRLI
jgi:hypothetical protein